MVLYGIAYPGGNKWAQQLQRNRRIVIQRFLFVPSQYLSLERVSLFTTENGDARDAGASLTRLAIMTKFTQRRYYR